MFMLAMRSIKLGRDETCFRIFLVTLGGNPSLSAVRSTSASLDEGGIVALLPRRLTFGFLVSLGSNSEEWVSQMSTFRFLFLDRGGEASDG